MNEPLDREAGERQIAILKRLRAPAQLIDTARDLVTFCEACSGTLRGGVCQNPKCKARDSGPTP